MEAAMGVSGPKAGMTAAANGPYGFASTKNPRGIDQTAFIDITYENPSGSKSASMNSASIPQQQNQHLYGYGGYPPNPNQPYMHPQMGKSFQNYPHIPPQQQQQQQRSQFPPQQFPQQPFYNNPNISASSAAGGGYRAQSLVSTRQRRNSNSSITTTSTVNRFMKKQWGRLGGGSGGNSSGRKHMSGYDDDEDGEANVDFNASSNEVSFDDIKHLRGDVIGAFGLNDSTPYIPTLTQTVHKGQNMSGEVYRKAQMNQKKAAAANIVKQQQFQKQQQQQQQQQQQYQQRGPMPQYQQMPLPRSMSLQAGNQSRFANYNGYPSQGMPQQAMTMQGVPPQGTASNIYPGAPQGYMPMQQQPFGAPSNGQYRPAQQTSQGPRSMSLQAINAKSMSCQNGNQMMQNRPNVYNSVPQPINEQQKSVVEAPDVSEKENVKADVIIDEFPKRVKTVKKIDFSSLSDDEGEVEVNGQGIPFETESDKEIPILEQSSPLKSESAGVEEANVPRSNIQSIVTFDSLDQKENSQKQKQIYGLKNNSTQQTVFYSANEFLVNSNQTSPEKHSIPNSIKEFNENVNMDVGSEPQIPKGKSLSISEINDSLNDMTMNLSTEDADNDETIQEEDPTIRYSATTVESTQPLYFNNGNEQLSSPIKPNELVDMGVRLKSPEPASEQKSEVLDAVDSEASLSKFSLKRRTLTPVSKSSAGLETPTSNIGRSSFTSEPKSPVSLGLSTPISGFTPEQCGLLNDNTQLLQELELVTAELASSVSREIKLEDNLKQNAKILKRKKSLLLVTDATNVGGDETFIEAATETEIGNQTDLRPLIRGVKFKENGDIEVDEGIEKCTQYAATITTLAQLLNDERKKRYIIEETLLQSQESINDDDLRNQLLVEKSQVQQLNIKLNYLNESEKLHRLEKDMLDKENDQLKLEVEALKKKYEKLKNKMKISVNI